MFKDRKGEVYARAFMVSGTLGAFVSSIVRDWATGSLIRNSERRSRELTNVLTRLGPSFVKVGQALSSRPDLLPKVYLDALSELQDRLDSFPTAAAFQVIEAELGKPLEAVYSQITPEPVAAASLGQVYKATLLSGELVAVKVRVVILSSLALPRGSLRAEALPLNSRSGAGAAAQHWRDNCNRHAAAAPPDGARRQACRRS